ncbi:AAA family ATPase [Chondrinema litorale]|uniref:AAA family ATPase n=1 Tax=Chondrinema litorale TaxID=2994555 RepID=UPI0025437616|nr:MoxR family ATPase [Chondrinema litorale]UZR94052.1 MoxR family ATPase [Chondrinema litorale]
MLEAEDASFESRLDLTELKETVANIRKEIAKIIVGQDEMVSLLLAAIFSDGHVLIEGVPGVAKTLTAKILSRIISTNFSRIQFTPDLMPSDVLGTNIYNTKEAKFEFKRGPVFSNIVLIDEINRAPAKTQAALFEVMEEKQVTIDGHKYAFEPPFIVIATQNPVEQEGTYRLPEAQLDRFLFKIVVDYPAVDEEILILQGFHERKHKNDLDEIQPIISAEKLQAYKELVSEVKVEKNIIEYIAQIVTSTRNSTFLFLGASPRASIAILSGAKAFAVLHGRDFVTPDDVQRVLKSVLIHRIILTPETELEGLTPEQVLNRIVEQIEVPR